MTALTRLLRTTVFRLALIYICSFTALSVFLFVFISQNTNALMSQQVIQTVDAETKGLSERYALTGINGLVQSIEDRVRRPDANLYLLVDFAGNYITGNISHLPTKFLAEADGGIQFVHYKRIAARDASEKDRKKEYSAAVRIFELPGNFRLLVGRDLEEQTHLHELLGQALRWWLIVMIVVAAVTWFFVNRRVLKRIDDISMTSQKLMHGDLSDRLKVTGTGDEFDRLAINLNNMLDRIEELMRGLKEVSDNIAHDLKTPLTRMRGRVEAALRQKGTEEENRHALEETLVETDELINTFNALLRIARVEAGSSGVKHQRISLSHVAEDICELYEPVAEMDEVAFTAKIEPEVYIEGDRELLSQALANLIENALKYGRPEDESQPAKIDVAVYRDGDTAVLSVQDNGKGIPSEDRERVCDRFVRLDQSRNEAGSGLGLSLVKAVISLHSGQLLLESGEPGLKATLKLPGCVARTSDNN
ncbi:HAMP domain-containing histidine kinase [Rhodobacteraceae bacterium RKSG542]|uniref:sensor histidine kinase n=1 Tax=Pseudovibrio flavus TaxID=2529854 RepID=UPI0035297D13|nr:HAMP domain-containing histidine kinase [Pseudovibrio flavus]